MTGGFGFIGLNLISRLTESGTYFVHNVDYYSLRSSYFDKFLSEDQKSRIKNYIFDINEIQKIRRILSQNSIQKVFHLAAESHVDRSITEPQTFFVSNVMGTLALVEACRWHIQENGVTNFRFLHVSTDEVYGDLDFEEEAFDEKSSYNPSSPYSASKASSDMIVNSWRRTFSFPGIVTNCSNNFGPCQHHEKFIPVILNALLSGRKVPVYGNGSNVRDWLFVDDHVDVLMKLMDVWPTEQKQFCIGGGVEVSNLELIKRIWIELNEMNLIQPSNFEDAIEFVSDRKGHDLRYAINDGRLNSVIKNRSRTPFETAIRSTIRFYLKDFT